MTPPNAMHQCLQDNGCPGSSVIYDAPWLSFETCCLQERSTSHVSSLSYTLSGPQLWTLTMMNLLTSHAALAIDDNVMRQPTPCIHMRYKSPRGGGT